MATYILFKGEFEKNRVIMVTEDVKIISKMYTELLREKEAADIEIWDNNRVVGYFHDYEKVERKVRIALSKLGKGIHKNSFTYEDSKVFMW